LLWPRSSSGAATAGPTSSQPPRFGRRLSKAASSKTQALLRVRGSRTASDRIGSCGPEKAGRRAWHARTLCLAAKLESVPEHESLQTPARCCSPRNRAAGSGIRVPDMQWEARLPSNGAESQRAAAVAASAAVDVLTTLQLADGEALVQACGAGGAKIKTYGPRPCSRDFIHAKVSGSFRGARALSLSAVRPCNSHPGALRALLGPPASACGPPASPPAARCLRSGAERPPPPCRRR